MILLFVLLAIIGAVVTLIGVAAAVAAINESEEII